MRFRFEKATQTDFNFNCTEFQTVLKAAELEFTNQIWQLAIHIYINNPLLYFKYLNRYVKVEYPSANLKFARQYAVTIYALPVLYAYKRQNMQ